LMRALLWSPRSPSPEGYNKLLLTHGPTLTFGVSIPALACGVGALLVPSAMGGASAATARLALGGWVAWVLGVVAVLADAQRLRPSLGTFSIALGLGLMCVHLGFACGRGISAKTARSKVAGLVFLAGLGRIAFECVITALASWELRSIDVPEGFVTMGDPVSMSIGGANALLAVALGLHLLLRRRDALDGTGPRLVPGLYVVLGVLPALLLWAATSAVIGAASTDLHLRDTYFEVAQTHAGASVVLLATLAGAHAWFEQLTGRRYLELPAILAAIVIPGGLLATTFNMLRLGREGMPRRYASYLDAFEPLHHAIGTAAAVTALGFTLLAVAVLLGKRIEPRGAVRADAVSGSRA
jgi:hypothetical protein